MHETKLRELVTCQRIPIPTRGIEQRECADNIGGNKIRGPVNRAIDVALGCEIDDGPRPVKAQQMQHQVSITDVAADEYVSRIALERGEIAEIAGVGQLVEVDDRLVAAVEPVENEIGTDEPGTSGHQNHAGSTRRGHLRAFLSRAGHIIMRA